MVPPLILQEGELKALTTLPKSFEFCMILGESNALVTFSAGGFSSSVIVIASTTWLLEKRCLLFTDRYVMLLLLSDRIAIRGVISRANDMVNICANHLHVCIIMLCWLYRTAGYYAEYSYRCSTVGGTVSITYTMNTNENQGDYHINRRHLLRKFHIILINICVD